MLKVLELSLGEVQTKENVNKTIIIINQIDRNSLGKLAVDRQWYLAKHVFKN